MVSKKNLRRAKRRIKTKFNKIKKKLHNFDPDSPEMRKFFLVFLIVFFLIADLAIWGSGHFGFGRWEGTSPIRTVSRLEKKAKELTSGHPMEAMVPYIVTRNKAEASYMLAIAKKESNFGKFSPKKDGRDCFNYWGYRGQYNKTASGYSCFDNPKQAVSVVGDRIGDLLAQNVDTPKEMSVWKCGYDCSWDNQDNVRKWVSDVDYYVDILNE